MRLVRRCTIGRSWRVPRVELERYVNRLEATPAPPRAERRRKRITTNQSGLFDVVHTPPSAG